MKTLITVFAGLALCIALVGCSDCSSVFTTDCDGACEVCDCDDCGCEAK